MADSVMLPQTLQEIVQTSHQETSSSRGVSLEISIGFTPTHVEMLSQTFSFKATLTVVDVAVEG